MQWEGGGSGKGQGKGREWQGTGNSSRVSRALCKAATGATISKNFLVAQYRSMSRHASHDVRVSEELTATGGASTLPRSVSGRETVISHTQSLQ